MAFAWWAGLLLSISAANLRLQASLPRSVIELPFGAGEGCSQVGDYLPVYSWQCWLFASGRLHFGAKTVSFYMEKFVKLYPLCSLGRYSEHECINRYWCWLVELWLQREKVVHLARSRSCSGFMRLWDSAELLGSCSENLHCCHICSSWNSMNKAQQKKLEENPGTENTWNADCGTSGKVHKLRAEWVNCSEQWDWTSLSEKNARGALQRKSPVATGVQFVFSLLIELQPGFETMTCKI